MSHVVDLDAYGRRIGFEGPFRANLQTLEAIVSRHIQAIPFESLDVLLNRPILLDTESLERKLIHERRGGYCFEQNGLLLAILQQIGFEACPMGARVRLGVDRSHLPPRTHLFVKVVLDGEPWMADVGVGGLSLSKPLRLNSTAEQETYHETRRFVSEGAVTYHQALLAEGWTDVHEFAGDEMPMIDRQLANWWTSTNPTSRFSTSLIAARSGGPGVRLTLLNDRFAKRVNGTVEEEITITNADQLLQILKSQFGLTFPPGTRFLRENASWPTT